MTRISEPNVTIPNPIAGTADGVSSTRAKTGPTQLQNPGGDQVATDTQSQLRALVSAVGDQGHSQRVEDLRALVQSGQYTVDPQALSGAIVDAMRQGY